MFRFGVQSKLFTNMRTILKQGMPIQSGIPCMILSIQISVF